MEKLTVTRKSVVLIFVSLATVSCGVEGLRSEDVFGLSPNPKAWLYGQVTDARSGAPVADASIQVGGISGLSNSNGSFRIDDLKVGALSGSASMGGYRPYNFDFDLRPGANSHNIVLQPNTCGSVMCGTNEFCSAQQTCVQGATLTGSVVSACTFEAIDARVTIDGKSTCSTAASGKGYLLLRFLQPGGPQTLSVGKVGWRAFSKDITLMSGFNTVYQIELTPLEGCSGPAPANVPCTCTQPNCQ
jgi:hypothetical protein